jgi:hypothetical protein
MTHSSNDRTHWELTNNLTKGNDSKADTTQDELDAVLCVMARHGVLVRPDELPVFYDGVRHTKAYKECKQALQALMLRQRVSEAKLARKQFTTTVDDSDFILANEARIAELTAQIEGGQS